MATKHNDLCREAALDDEVLFTLLARDPHAPHLVRAWANKRQFDINEGTRPKEDQAKVDEAFRCADEMLAWREANDGKWRK